MKKYLSKFNNLEPLTIVTVGDSTTSQEWCHPNWVDWLNFTFKQQPEWPKGLDRSIFNSGKDGAFIHDFIDNYSRYIGIFNPDVVIVSLGFNHIELAGTVDIESQIRQLFNLITANGSDLITWSTYAIPHQEHSLKLKEIRQQYAQITREFDGVFVDVYTEFLMYDLEKLFTYTQLDGNELWQIPSGGRDYLHCNEIGNQIIAQKIAQEAFGVELLDWEDMGTMHQKNLSDYLR